MQLTPEILPCLWFDGLVGARASASSARDAGDAAD